MEPGLENDVPAFLGPSFTAGQECCGLCLSAPARYTCPRCNALYCSLSCYRGGRHRGCSEAFYRDEVLRGLQEAGGGPKGDIEGILKRVREAQLRTEEEQGPEDDGEEEEEALSAEDEHEVLEADGPLDEESLDPETLWQKLTPEEQQDFERLLEKGGLGALLQPWQPWWENHESALLLQEVGQTHQALQEHNVTKMTSEQISIEGSLDQKGGVQLPKVRHSEGQLGSTTPTDVIISNYSKMEMQQGDQALQQNDRVVQQQQNDRVVQQHVAQNQHEVVPKITISGGHRGPRSHGRINTVTASKKGPDESDAMHRNPEKAGIEVTAVLRHDVEQKKQDTPFEKRHCYAGKGSGLLTALNKRPIETEQEIDDVQKETATVTFSKEARAGAMIKLENTVSLSGQEHVTVVNSKFCESGVFNAQTEHCGSGTLSPTMQKNIDSNLVEPEQSKVFLQQSQTQGVLANENKTDPRERVPDKNILGWLPATNQTPIPHVRLAIPPLCSLSRNPSPLVRFNLVNILYAYAFSLKLYNGDLGEDFLLQECCETVLAVSGALSSTRVFDSTAEALQAGIQAVLTKGSQGDPQGAALAVSHILLGVSHGGRKNYTLAALSHLADIFVKARRLAPKEEKQFIFNAKKKCEFLLSWANENEDSLTLLSVEAQSEYKRYVTSLKEVERVTHELEKSWGGNKTPQKKVLIHELD